MTIKLSADFDINIPLIIDLDGTLIIDDSLHVNLLHILFKKPLKFPAVFLSLLKGRAAFKRHAADVATVPSETLVFREDILDLIQQTHIEGRKIFLVTAADQSIADNIQNHLKCFDGVKGSDGSINLKGRNKLNYLLENYSNGFIYAGDSSSDMPIWEAAKAAIIVESGSAYTDRLREADIPVMTLSSEKISVLRDWSKALRIHQWAKNILIFVPIFLGHIANNTDVLTRTSVAFLLFGMIASATYLINDLADLDADRNHPTKRLRPLASGRISITQAFIMAFILMAIGIAGAVALNFNFVIVVLIYLVLTLAYSFWLKRLPFIDVTVIATLFTLRVAMGAVLNDLALSPWLFSFSALFFFSLSVSKRHVEVMRAFTRGLDSVRGRGYFGSDWPLTLSYGIASAVGSIIILLLFIAESASSSGFYDKPYWLYVSPICIFLWVQRVWLFSHRMQLDDDPVVFALKDRVSYILGVVVLGSFLMAL